MIHHAALVLSLLLLAPALGQSGQPVIPHRQDQPPNEPYEPAAAVQRMTVPPGFSVELVASEPAIVNPIAMTFDDRGRIWITESVEYPRKSAGPGKDRVKVLEDTTGNGKFDKITTFAEGLNIPTGIAVGHGGVWILNAPDLLFLKEKDGKEISRQVVLTGFGRTDTHELPSSLTWGPDGWLYGLNGVFNHCRVASPFPPGGRAGKKVFDFTCALWRVHPRTHEFQVFCEGTSNPYGLVWDPEGSALVSACHWATDHVFHFVETGYYQRQAGAYPPFTIPIGSITNHSHQKTAYCGLCYFDSDTYPEKYRGRLYMGNIHGGCINVDMLHRAGSTYLSDGEPDFLTAHDAWFMPVSQKLGPDGCLYVLDWYDRYHCAQDAARDPQGVDRERGRLYRVRYQGTPPAGRFDLAQESDDALIKRLASPNLFYRETAQRLLCERDTPTLRDQLEKLVEDASAPRKARLHALWALVGTGKLRPDFHGRLLTHADATFRAWGVRAAGNIARFDPQGLPASLRAKVASLARDPSPDVQLQVAIAARKLDHQGALPILVEVLAACGQDKLVPSIVWPNLQPLLEDQSRRLVQLLQRTDLQAAPAILKLMPRVLERILSRAAPDTDSVPVLFAMVADSPSGPGAGQDNVSFASARACLAVISAKARELGEADVAALKKGMQPILKKLLGGKADDPLYLSAHLLAAQLKIGALDGVGVRRLFVAPDQPEAVRLQALEALVTFRDPGMREAVASVLAKEAPRFLTKVLDVLGRGDDPRVADLILDRYPTMDAELQPLAIELLMERKVWTSKLLNAALKKRLPAGALNVNHLRRILDGNDREAVWAVEKAFGTVRSQRNPQREQVVAEMDKYLRAHPGDPRAGRQAFKKVCAQCHTIYGEGASVGPDLSATGRASFEQLLSNVFDPSLVIGPGYQSVTVVTKAGRSLTGLIAEDNTQRIVLKLPGGAQEVIPRHDVEYASVSQLSLMPEGIESLMDRRELADLLAFLALDRPPEDPLARPIPGAPGRVVAGAVAAPVALATDKDAKIVWLKPPALMPGDMIAFVAPAAPAELAPLLEYKKRLEKGGYSVLIPKGIEQRRNGYLGGTDDERAAELNAMIRDPKVRAIFPVRGGYGLTRILDRIDYAALRKDPKIITGYSDLTALHLAIARKARLITFHSPMPMFDLWQEDNPKFAFEASSFRRAVFADQYKNGETGYVVAVPAEAKPVKLVGGTARGRLLGGNLTLICATLGTPYAIQPRGAILLVEDVDEAPYRVDRSLSQLRLAGVLDAVAGVVVGSFLSKKPGDAKELSRVLREYFGALKVPVLMDFPVGHTPYNATLPHGGLVELDADRGVLRLLENPVRIK